MGGAGAALGTGGAPCRLGAAEPSTIRPPTWGALRSSVTVFFSFLPFWISSRSALRPADGGGALAAALPPPPKAGGGGGGGGADMMSADVARNLYKQICLNC